MARVGRRARATEDAARTPTALVASAKRMKGAPDPAKMARRGEGWQDAAWHFYDTVGEYAYAVNWVGNLLSRAKLYATLDTGEGPKRVATGQPADSYMDAFFGSESGRAQCLRQIGVHYTVPGECYIVGMENEHGYDDWQIVAASKMQQRADGWYIGGSSEPLPEDTLVIRIWRPHPVESKRATSPSRAALPILSEIERLTMHVAAQVDSRLASAGILFLPKEMTFSVSAEKDADGNATSSGSASKFVKELQEVMGAAIANRDDARALVPIVVTADGEFLDKAHHLTFWSELDNQAIELRTEAIRRLALSMDMPPEVLTGQGETNHWAAWQIDESAIKSHTEPLLNQIANDIAIGYLRPLLIADGMDEAEAAQYGVGVDTAEMRLRPNRSQEALELWDRGVLNDQTLLTETGFHAADDLPTDVQRAFWLTMKVATGSNTPEQVQAALEALGVALQVPAADGDDTDVRESPDTPSLEEHPRTGTPEDVSAALIAGAEVLVFRALERAGNRLRNKFQTKVPGVQAAETYMYVPSSPSTADFALEDAWTAVERFAPQWGVDPNHLTQALDSYTRVLLAERKPHDPALLRSYVGLLTAKAAAA